MVHLASKRLTQPPIEQHTHKETIWNKQQRKQHLSIVVFQFSKQPPLFLGSIFESRVSQKLEDWHLQNVVASLPHI